MLGAELGLPDPWHPPGWPYRWLVTPLLHCRRQSHLLAQLRLLGFQLCCGPRQCKVIWEPAGLQPSQPLSRWARVASRSWGPDTRHGEVSIAAGFHFSHIGTAHDCSERRDTSKNVLVPKSAKQMVVVQPSRGSAGAGSWHPCGPWKQPVSDVQSHLRARGVEVLLRHSRICLCSVYGPSVIH